MLFKSIYKLLNNDDCGQLAKCWLAATNKKDFQNLNVEKIESIVIPNLCDEILKNLPSQNTMESRCFISFSSASKLMLGTVLIYKTQVDHLFERTRRLNHDNKYLFFGALGNYDFNKTDNSKPPVNSNKKKKDLLLSNAVSWTSTDLLNEIEQMEKLAENQFSFFDDSFQCKRNEDISLKEVFNDEYWEKKFEENEEDFLGQITDIEIKYLSDVLNKKKKLFHSNNDLNTSIDLVRTNQDHIDTNMEIDVCSITMNNLNDLNKSIDSMRTVQDNIDTNMQIDHWNISLNNLNDSATLDTLLLEDISPSEKIILPDIVSSSSLPDLIDSVTMYNTNKSTKRRKLAIDNKKELTINYINNRANTYDNLRCTNPREDIVPTDQLKFISAENLLQICGHRNSNFHLKFPRILKRKKESNNMKGILAEILEKKTSKSSAEELLHCSAFQAKRRKTYDKDKRKLSPENSLSHLNDSQLTQNNENNSQNTNLLDRVEQNITQQILEEFPIDMTDEDDLNEIGNNEALAIKRRTFKEFNVLSVIRNLLKLWQEHVNPINISTLFEISACKVGAAKGFSSLLELNGKRYIKIIKDNETHNIIHIEPGEKIPAVLLKSVRM